MNDKVSKYNIEVEYNQGMLLYNTLTNKMLPMSFKDYAVIETLLENLPTFKNRFPDLYSAFQKSGFIVESDFEELSYIKLQNKRRIFMDRNYHLTINPTLDCNLNCWYCSVNYAETKHDKKRMSDETVQALSKHIHTLVTQQKANSILLDWFGGEPLMYFDEVMKKVSDAALKVTTENHIELKQKITTNATLLNKERIQYMKDANFRFFQISMDGNERRQNLIKYDANKNGTYRDVINHINLIADIIPDVSICLRINYDRQTLKHIKDITHDFSEKSKSCINIDFQRVWQIPCTDEMRKLLEIAKEEFKAAGFVSRFWAYKPLTFKCCYADSYNHYVVNYDGRIFKCTARDYGEDLVLGNLQPSGYINWNDKILSRMFEKATFENEKCENCKLLPLCMGPCIQKNYEARIKNTQVGCLYENVEYSLSSYIIETAKQRNLI